MTHLGRIFIQKTSAYSHHPFSAIFPVSSAMFVSLYCTKLSGENIPPEDGEKKLLLMVNGIKCFKFSGDSEAETIMAPKGEFSTKKSGKMSNLYEKVDGKYLKNLRFVTGISISLHSLGWAEIDLVENSLVVFKSEILDSKSKSSAPSLADVYSTVSDVRKQIPKSDLYIMENNKFYGTRCFPETQVQYLSTFYTLLNLEDESGEGKVILQKQSVVNCMFELLVGRERVSAHQKIQRMLCDFDWKNVEDGEVEKIPDLPNLSQFKLGKDFINFIYDPKVSFKSKDACSLALLMLFSFIEINKPRMTWSIAQTENN